MIINPKLSGIKLPKSPIPSVPLIVTYRKYCWEECRDGLLWSCKSRSCVSLSTNLLFSA